MNRPLLCLVEDDPIMGESLHERLLLEGYGVDWHTSAKSALECYPDKSYALILSDIRMPDMNGDDFFYKLNDDYKLLPPVIFITGYGTVEKAVELLRHGAADFITKPFEIDQLIEKISALVSRFPAAPAITEGAPLFGVSNQMRRLEAMLPKLVSTGTTILITGESGVGKEVIAQQIHNHMSGRSDKPFVAVNCGAITSSLLEAELFGYEKGAFTGATRTKYGVFEQAEGGTLLLDEIGEMPLDMQVNLLRVLQERCVTRVGGERSIPVDVRVICATNKDLKAMVAEGSFREDLFFRINVIHLSVPPLRERCEDIIWFANLFLSQFQEDHPESPQTIDHSAEYALLEYHWPGNLRELKHTIERACVLSHQQRLTAKALFCDQLWDGLGDEHDEHVDEDLQSYMRLCERDFILRILEQHAWHITETAEALGISRKNLWEKMKKLSINAPDDS